SKVAFDEGDEVQVKVRAIGAVAANALRLELVKGDQTVRVLPITPEGREAGRFTAAVGRLGKGEYELRLSETSGEAAPPISVVLHVTADYETELADVSGDESVLARLAEGTGGEQFQVDQMERL